MIPDAGVARIILRWPAACGRSGAVLPYMDVEWFRTRQPERGARGFDGHSLLARGRSSVIAAELRGRFR